MAGDLALRVHAALGDQQHDRTGDQQTAEDVEDGGADAAGGGQLCAGLVQNLNLIHTLRRFGSAVDNTVFTDDGKPYDPTTAKEPDITLSAEEREIGGLGIFMVKKMAAEISYRYEGGKNLLNVGFEKS